MKRVAVSILNYNSTQSTIACVRSLLNARHETGGSNLSEVFIADNDSSADEWHQLQKSLAGLPDVHLQLNAVNQGFSAGHNGNLRTIFLHSHPDYIWLLNNDCLVYEEALPSLIKCAQQHPDVGIWGATLLESDGKTIQCAGGCFYNSWTSYYRQYGQGKALAKLDQLKPADCDYIAGAALFFPVATLTQGLRSLSAESSTDGCRDQKQWLNESFFLYFEELDLAQRLKPGLAMAWCKHALVRHTGGTSTGTGDDQRSDIAEYNSTLSALKYTRFYHHRRLWFMSPVRYLLKCLQLSVKGEFRLLWSLTRAYRDFWRGLN